MVDFLGQGSDVLERVCENGKPYFSIGMQEKGMEEPTT